MLKVPGSNLSHAHFEIFLFNIIICIIDSGADFWQNRGFNDKSVKTSKIVHLDLLNKIGYGPIA